MRMRTNNAMYRYLEAHSLLDKGSEAIKEGKARYRKEYLTNHKRTYRKRTTSHTITCNPVEEKAFAAAAQEHGMSVAEYLRMASLAYTEKKYLVPRSDALVKLRQELIFLRSQITRIGTAKQGLFQRDRSAQIETLLSSFMLTVHTTFSEPKDVETMIREVLKEQPEFIAVLQTILSDHDNKVAGAQK